MGLFILYLIESAGCLALFYLLYKGWLARETFFRLNRVALLGCWALAFLLPAVHLAGMGAEGDFSSSLARVGAPVAAGIATGAPTPIPTDHGAYICVLALSYLYLAGLLVVLAKEVCAWARLYGLLRGGRRVTLATGTRALVVKAAVAPFCWMRTIVLSEEDYRQAPREVIAHESAHARRLHSLDLLLIDLALLLQWFNPAAWALKRETRAVHEYEADRMALDSGVDTRSYQLSLIKRAVGPVRYAMANSFNHSSLKNRIVMMSKKKSSPWAYMKYAGILPLAIVASAALAHPEVSQVAREFAGAKVSVFPVMTENVLEKTAVTDPEFPGGQKEFHIFLAKNLRYAVDAQKKGVQGRVVCAFTVGTDGSVKGVRVVNSVDPALDNEVVRTLQGMPKWTPAQRDGQAVEAEMTCGVVFKFEGDPNAPKGEEGDIVVVGFRQ